MRMAQIAMVVLFALAMVATVVMVFSDNELWMRIGLLAALWSALVGAILFARERRQTQTSADREAELKRVYSLELESEVAARRERELSLREELREEVRAENDESISSLRVEVMALRSQLEQLGVQPIVDGDAAVGARKSHPLLTARADAAGYGEPEPQARPAQPAQPSRTEQTVPERPVPEPPVEKTPPRPSPYDAMPSTEVTSSMRKVSAESPAPEPASEHAPELAPDRAPERAPEPVSEKTPEPAADTESQRPGGPHTDRFRSFEGFRLTAPPSFTDDAELPDFDAPTGFEPATGAEKRERFADTRAPAAGYGAREIPSAEPTPEFFGGRHGRREDDAAPAAPASSADSADGDLYAPRHGRAASTADTETAAEQAAMEEQTTTEPQTSEPESTGRRAAAEPAGSRHGESGGTSVADLLARLGDGDRPAGDRSSGGRRRRRED